MLGLNKGEVVLVNHSDEWKQLFDEERSLLHSVIGTHIIDIQQIGSTAIEGIEAKPIMDIMVGLNSLEDIDKFNMEKLKEVGYYHLPKVRIEGKTVFAKFTDLENLTKTHVVHVVEYRGDWWEEHLFFRNYLKENRTAAKEYEQLKKLLAEKYPNDERSYTNEKKKFVESILKMKKHGS